MVLSLGLLDVFSCLNGGNEFLARMYQKRLAFLSAPSQEIHGITMFHY